MHYSFPRRGYLVPDSMPLRATRLSPPSASARFPRPLLDPIDRAAGAGEPARVLIVEDDYFVALDVEHRLQQAGFSVVGVAASAEEAFEIARAEKPALAIMDIRISGVRDGIDTAIELLTSLGVPSIFATAHGDSETRERAKKAQPLGWLQKPYSSEALIAAVRSALANINWR